MKSQQAWLDTLTEAQCIIYHEQVLAGRITSTMLQHGRWEEIRVSIIQEEAYRRYGSPKRT
jgi:hypothetical protein